MGFITRLLQYFHCIAIDTVESNMEPHPRHGNSAVPSSLYTEPTVFLSICFPTEDNTTFRLRAFIDEPTRIPDYIANYIKVRGLPFEVTVYDHHPEHTASFFFLPYAYEKVEDYARRHRHNHTGIESYEITPQYQQEPSRKEKRKYDVWIEYVHEGLPLNIRVAKIIKSPNSI